ncbi:MAG: LytR family transcriptional regulator, partial [Rhodococcus sp. (in: high G+C Gram-positive bacteria)]
MSDDRDSNSPVPESRAPWERPISRIHRPDSSPTAKPQRWSRPEDGRAEVEAPTEKIAPITASTPRPVTARPQPVGVAVADRPALTRLAMSKVRRRNRIRTIARGCVSIVAILAVA